MTLWMAVTDDEYELPIAVGRSAFELADMLGVKANSIYAYFCDCKASKRKCKNKYTKVEIDDDDEED